jgi:hypothetical protein
MVFSSMRAAPVFSNVCMYALCADTQMGTIANTIDVARHQ